MTATPSQINNQIAQIIAEAENPNLDDHALAFVLRSILCRRTDKHASAELIDKANRRLYAAPELLEALKVCQVRVFMHEGSSPEYQQAAAAIRKATE